MDGIGKNVKMEILNELHLFAGAGGGILGGLLLGHRPVCAVEIEPYCRDILLQRQRDGVLPKFPIWDDVKTFDGKPWMGRIDIVCGGFPCQDISCAGSGKGIEGSRSGLWKEMARIIGEVRPKFVFVENSPMLVGRGLAVVIGDFAKMGYDVRWCVLGTKDIGGHCKGERIWIAAKTSKSGWREMVRCGQKVGPEEVGRRTSNNAYTRSRAGRIQELEKMVGEPAILGSNDGLAHRVDRLHATGNGQNPFLAAKAWNVLMGLNE